MLTAPDQAIWDKALEPGAVIVSKDRDFVEWAMSRRPSPQVVWLRLGNTPTNTLIKRLEGSSREILASLEAGALTVEIGK